MLSRDYENGLGDHMAIKRHDGLNSDLLSVNYIDTSRTVMYSVKSGYLGSVLSRVNENGLSDHMAIKCHDGPNSDLFSMNYIKNIPDQL